MAAATDEYVRGLQALQADAPLSVGGRCLVKAAEGAATTRSAMIMSMDGGASTADVLYEGGDGEAADEANPWLRAPPSGGSHDDSPVSRW